MYKNNVISVVVPAHNEEKLIVRVIDTCPEYVDKIIIVNDCSTDKTQQAVEDCAKKNSKVVLINHQTNQGVGGAIATGYKWSRDNNIDVAVVVGGDAQMDPNDMPSLLDAVIDDKVDYAKGNRLFVDDVRKKMPAFRYYGNQLLSLMTKMASGYWHVFDSQCGYTAINKKALKRINWDKMYKRYGMPNDLLVRLNVENMRVRDIPINSIYGIGEKSGIKVRTLVFTLSVLLFKKFLWRLKEKYVVRNFHPLVLFYTLGGIFGALTAGLTIRLLYFWIFFDQIPRINALGAFFAFTSCSLFSLFAMWFDMDQNKELK